MPKFSPDKISKEDAVLKALVTDLAGGFKEIIFPSSKITELITPGIAYDGSSFAGINTINASDAILKGVPETLVRCPEAVADTKKAEYWIICNIHNTDGTPHRHCGRSTVIALQEKLSQVWQGGYLYMGSEPEAYFVESEEAMKVTAGNNTNYFNPKDPKAFIITEISNYLDEMGYEIERAHTEVGEEQFETNWRFDMAERTADKIQMYKLLTHKVAREYGFDVTFLPKPYPERNGSGMHCHISVQNKKANLFYDAKKVKQRYFSDTALQFLQGILSNVRPIAAVANSTEASYARLVPRYEAPCVVAIGDCNRSAACRIPAIVDEKIRKMAIRTEFRFPDPLANPYLLAASFIASGLHGIEKKLKFQGFCEEDLFALDLKTLRKKGYSLLPRTLWEAYTEFVECTALKKYLGESLHEAYSDLVLEEIDRTQPHANSESMRLHYLR